MALTTGDLATASLASRGSPIYHTRYDNLAPRVGFAIAAHPSMKHPLVVRGGFGIFYDTGQALGALGFLAYPFGAVNNLRMVSFPPSSSALAPPSLDFPLVAPYPYISGLTNPNLELPYTEQWNLSMDQGLGAKNTLTVSYVGNNGKELLFTEAYGNLQIVNPLFTAANVTNNGSSSTYNAFQLQDTGYVSTGVRLLASYAWAHGIDNASSDASLFPAVRGNSDNDVRQVFNTALNYEIIGIGSHNLLGSLTRGWAISFRSTIDSGYPLDINQGQYTLPNGAEPYVRPDVIPGTRIYLHNVTSVLGGWALNPQAFQPVATDPVTGAPLRQGTLGRNFIHGPAFWIFNTAIQRTFPVHERFHLIFRVEAFNVFNHANPGGIDTNILDSTFGQPNGLASRGITNSLYSTGSPRSLQLMLKFEL